MVRLIRSLVSLAVLIGLVAAGYLSQNPSTSSAPAGSTSTTRTQQGPPAASHGKVVDRLTHVPGYDRDCGKGDGCVFGPAWSDATDAPMSRNGCDTRSDILRTQLRDTTIKPNTRGCVILAGTLTEPYTGQTITYQRTQQPATVHVDHVIPLARAWDAGAAGWTLEKRARFANDPRNLTAASAATNTAKSDQGPAEWAQRISDPGRRCAFLRKAATVTTLYGLATTRDDQNAFTRCGITSRDRTTWTTEVS